VWRPGNVQWWILISIALFIAVAWPSGTDKSLAAKFVNWAVDPTNELPVLPDQLPLGLGDDADAVATHDALVWRYDTLYNQGGWMRTRLELKAAGDPFEPGTTRQVLALIGVVSAFLAWRFLPSKS